MVPVRLALRNFLSYGEDVPPLDFTLLHVVCLSGDNGHGKSALLDAMTWAVWGEARKAAGARKPDEDVLRKGASEMAVEFEFDLEGDRYRILRQYRAARGGKSALEFQVYSPESDGFHSLTQPSITATQQRITETLRMDYTTFINSVFILQGRADEFTRRSARERKEILTEILGLWRYDELEERARQRAGSSEKTARDRERRLREIDTDLEDEPACQERIAALTSELKILSGQLHGIDDEIAAVQVQQASHARARTQLAELRAQQDSRQKAFEELRTQIARQQTQAAAFEQALAEREAIEQAHQEVLTLTADQERLNQDLQTLRLLERRKTELARDIDRARHEVEIRKQGLEARQESSARIVEEVRGLIDRQTEIEKGYQDLLLARRADEQWDEKRHKYDEIERQMRVHNDALLKAESALQTELAGCRHRSDELERRAASLDQRRAKSAALRERMESLHQLDRKRQSIEERGRELNAVIDMEKNRIKLLEHDDEEAQTRLKMLRRGKTANCPLCDAALDERRRETIETHIGDDLSKHAMEIQKLLQGIKLREDEKKQRAVEFKELRPQLDALPQVQQESVAADAAVQEATGAVQEARLLRQQMDALQGRLDGGQFAEEVRQQLQVAQSARNALGYDPGRHQTLKSKLRVLQAFEADKARLEEARTRHEAAAGELSSLRERLAEIDRQLEAGAYADDARAELGRVELDIETLGYDEALHQRSRQRLTALKDVAGRKEKLDQAIRQYDDAREALKDRETRAEALQTELTQLAGRIGDSERELTAAEDMEKRFDELKIRRQAARREEDETNQRLGAEKEKARIYKQLAEERPTAEQERQQAAKDQQIYEKLMVAFSKDGIPALIIENTIPEIEEEANRLLSRLTGNQTQIAIEPLRNLKTGGTKETLDIHISDEMGTRPYEMFSGGEAFRTNFALRIALSRLLANRAGTRLRTLIVDEGFGTQDTQGLEHLIDALQSIQGDFEKIIVVTHLERLKNAFPARIEVTKYPDIGSRYEVIV